MIKLFSVKEKQKKEAEAAKEGVKKQTAGELRVQKDMTELNLSSTTSIAFPKGPDHLLDFEVTLMPNEGYHAGGEFVFSFAIAPVYPHEAPKVKCLTKCYHPNIDLDGNVCLNILREDWKPVLSINSIVYGLQHLFLDPNPDDPLNQEAAKVLREDPRQFAANVRRSMMGGYVCGTHFERHTC
uniref:UBC core domain-containing protein n=1 Tax=Prasinoderma singulare TaxID=676789 RepID=A0A7S3FGQ9_9VIRI